jgi:Protein of unknown function (DUF4058)
LPLQPHDTAPIIDLQALLNEVYQRSGYDYFIDYQQNPLPPLSEPELAWIDELLRAGKLR